MSAVRRSWTCGAGRLTRWRSSRGWRR
jgi:hypothetical protein